MKSLFQNNFLNLYRFFSKEKVSSMRLLLYPILGLIFAKTDNIPLIICDLLFVFGGILFASLLNDYYDFKLQGEENSIGKMITSGQFCESRIKRYIWLPCIIPLILFYPMLKLGASHITMLLLSISFLLSLCYCAPYTRFKKIPFLGTITPPIGIYLLFAQALLINNSINLSQIIFAILLFIYSWYLDFIHLANDSIEKNETIKISGNNAIKWAKASAIIALLFSFLIFNKSNIALIPIAFWTIRLSVIWNININSIANMRKDILSRLYCIEEFAIYAIIAIIQSHTWG